MKLSKHPQKNFTTRDRTSLYRRLSKELSPFTFDDLPLDSTGDTVFSDLYMFQRVLGAGSFGVVVAAVEKLHLEQCAVKIVSKRNSKNSQLSIASHEAETLAKLEHPCIVKFHKTHVSNHHYFIVMELLKPGSLWDLLCLRARERRPLDEKACKVIMKQIFEGLDYLHSVNIVHRDLKPANVLLKSFDHLENSVRLADFGLCTKVDPESYYNPTEKCGTVSYMAPEVMQGKQYSSVPFPNT